MNSWNIREHILEYDDDNHQYLVDGVIVKSVTQLMSSPEEYAQIPKAVLDNAARRGTLIHETIEAFGDADNGTVSNPEIRNEIRGWFFLKRRYGFKVYKTEIPIIVPYNGVPIAAGRFDVLYNNGEILADYKTTSKLYKDKVALQLTIYKKGLEYSYGVKPQELMAIWLKDLNHKAVKLDPLEEEAEKLLREEYKRCKEELNRYATMTEEIPL